MNRAVHPREPFDSFELQALAARFGMWTFLVTEAMFFGPVFLAYLYCRLRYPEQFTLASRHTDIVLGTLNTAVLLTSSLTMMLAVKGVEWKTNRFVQVMLLVTGALGLVFLALKGLEYRHDWQEALVPGASFRPRPGMADSAQLFFYLYFAGTGLHALHLSIGIVLVLALAALARRRRLSPTVADNVGLYWHFVDIVWIFLYPMLYLLGRNI